jgi:D-sedoheptulose 7-phosphate isomerase
VGASAYFRELADTLPKIDAAAVERLTVRIRIARGVGATVYTCGNGGSASTASHLALDLAKNTRRPDRPNLRALGLTDNVGLITAWANDAAYDQVFAAQLDAVVRPDDLVVAISASGNSMNVLNAVRVARAAGAFAFGITGYAGGKLLGQADDCVVVPSDNMQVIEDAHLAIVHAVISALRDDG